MRKQVGLVLILVLTMLCGCTSTKNETDITAIEPQQETQVEQAETQVEQAETQVEQAETQVELLVDGKSTGVYMVYDEILDDYSVSIDDIELFKTDGLFKSIVEGFNGRYECYEDSTKAEWEITVSTTVVDQITNKYKIEKVEEQRDNSISICLKAFVNDNTIEICEGQVNEFRLSTNDLRMLLPVTVEINTENNSINLCPIYFN